MKRKHKPNRMYDFLKANPQPSPKYSWEWFKWDTAFWEDSKEKWPDAYQKSARVKNTYAFFDPLW